MLTSLMVSCSVAQAMHLSKHNIISQSKRHYNYVMSARQKKCIHARAEVAGGRKFE